VSGPGRRWRLLGAVAAVALVAAGCAIPTQTGPQTIGPSHVPFNLLSPVLTTTPTTAPRVTATVPVKVYFLTANNDLQAVARVLAPPAPLTQVLDTLLAGPTTNESSNGTSTAIPDNVVLLSASPDQSNVVTVNFNEAFAQISGTDTELAVAQVVATVAALDGLGTGVIFEINGFRTSVPIASGAQEPGPVYLWQFIPNAP